MPAADVGRATAADAPPATAPRRFRFAPTPSRELHVGNALAALFGWAACRAARGHFILRIEDIDRARCRPAFEAQLLSDLTWLGLDWDEAPTRQSERLASYDALLGRLVADGAAYACRCSRADIRAAQSAPHLGLVEAAAEVPYPGTCRGLDAALPADRGGYRFAVERLGDAAIVSWDDALLGPMREDVRDTSGDFLLGRPGVPTYQLAVVADDHAMGVTDIVRGRDLLGSTARQILFHRHLGGPVPRFAHHPLLVDDAGRKLSKRDAGLTLVDLARAGVDPCALGAALGRAVGLFGPEVRRAAPSDWVDAVAAVSERSAPSATAAIRRAASALHDGPWDG